MAKQPKSRMALAALVSVLGGLFLPLGFILAWVFFRTRRAHAMVMTAALALHGVNIALFPSPDDVTMIQGLTDYPVGSVAFELVGALVAGALYYWFLGFLMKPARAAEGDTRQ